MFRLLPVVAVVAIGHTANAQFAYVNVAVATVWTSPQAPRAIDRPALGNPVDLRRWTNSLNTTARRGLIGRIETQALYGEVVQVTGRRATWTHVSVTDQPTPRDARGYPGWIPSAQLTAGKGFGSLLQGRVAIVVRRTTVLHSAGKPLELSYGTRLPVLGNSSSHVVVATPDGGTGQLARAAVSTFSSSTQVPHTSGQQIAAAARMFAGVRYLWGGTSAYGFDCSGLIELVYRVDGLIIPRDADAQSHRGVPVSRSRLRAGDLLFYGHRPVDHVTLYVGGGKMIEAPNSSSSVRVTGVRTFDYAGARRYLTG